MPRVHWLAGRGRATPADRPCEIALASFSLSSPQLPAQPRPCFIPFALGCTGRNSHELGDLLNPKAALPSSGAAHTEVASAGSGRLRRCRATDPQAVAAPFSLPALRLLAPCLQGSSSCLGS